MNPKAIITSALPYANGEIHLGLRSVNPKFTSTVISNLWKSTQILLVMNRLDIKIWGRY